MKTDVGTVFIKMVEVICVWRVVSGSTGTWGQSTVSFMQLTFLSAQNLQGELRGGRADLRGDTLVKWAHVEPERTPPWRHV